LIGARRILLGVGPLAIIAGSYWLAFSDAGRPADRTGDAAPPSADARQPASDPQLREACRRRRNELASIFPPGTPILVRPPFVLAGDVGRERLERLHRELVVPVSRALHTCYFDLRPTEPVTILVFAGDRTYQEAARKLDGRTRAWYSGYYQRDGRRIMVNLATGDGTLAHELTHALAHFDCPGLPQWFDEGLASLHEACRISDDGLKLVGHPNWRFTYLAGPLREGRLPTINTLMSLGEIRGEGEAVVYAQARYFCLYLQHRGLLAHYYRKLKGTISQDPTGRAALRDLLHADSLDGVDRDFRQWLQRQPQQ
jgi:hypothetical protein